VLTHQARAACKMLSRKCLPVSAAASNPFTLDGPDVRVVALLEEDPTAGRASLVRTPHVVRPVQALKLI
jgi:hypothetical protein